MAAFIRISSSSSDTEYLVDPEALTCQCPDWVGRRQQFPRTDPRRLCKHLLAAILGEGTIPNCLAKYEDTFFRYSNFEERGFPLAQAWTTVQIHGQAYDIFLPSSPNESWINIYSDEEKWGYHRFDKRWSYNEIPSVADELLTVVRNLEAKERHSRPRQTKLASQHNGNSAQLPGAYIIVCPFCSMEFDHEDVERKIYCPVCGERLDGEPEMITDQSTLSQMMSPLPASWDRWIKGLFFLIGMVILLGLCSRK